MPEADFRTLLDEAVPRASHPSPYGFSIYCLVVISVSVKTPFEIRTYNFLFRALIHAILFTKSTQNSLKFSLRT